MGVVASWGSKTFLISDDQLYSFEGFSTEISLASDEQRDDGGKPATNVKGADLEKLSFSLKVGADYGSMARREKDEWHELLAGGTAYPFVLNGKPWSEGDFQLKKVGVSEPRFGPNGEMIFATLALEFQEWQGQAAVQKKTSANKASGGASKAGKAAAASKNTNAATAVSSGSIPVMTTTYTEKNASLSVMLPKGG